MKHELLCALAFAACALSACAPQEQTAAAPSRAQLIERGRYLVLSVAGCNDCHTPMTPQGPDMARTLQGADLIFKPIAEMPWAPHAPQIAGLPDGFTEAQFAHFMQTGERPSGVPVLPPMPPYRMNAEDAAAIAAYISTLPKAQAQ